MEVIDLTLEASQTVNLVLALDSVEFVELTLQAGLEGPPGPRGPSGLASPPLLHNQVEPSSAWIVVHNLGYWPQINVYTDTGEIFLPDIVHGSLNAFTVIHAQPTTGVVTYR